MIIFKENVRILRYTPAIEWILHCLRQIDMMPDDGQPSLCVTSINDSIHSKEPKSRHYSDEAIDVRSHDFLTQASKLHFRQRLEAMLNSHPDYKNCFSVLFEDEGTPNEHIHAQVRKGIAFLAP